MCSKPLNWREGKGRRQLGEIAPRPKYFLNISPMTTTPATRERPLDIAAPATPRAGSPNMPFINKALQAMFMTFTNTETSIVCFMS